MRCSRCLMPGQVSPIQDGLCERCRNPAPPPDLSVYRQDLSQLLATRPRAVVCLSGGKDSTYLLYRLKVEYNLDVVAFTVDSNVPDVAWDNMTRTCKALGVRHVVHRPPSDDALFRWLLTHQRPEGAVRTVCWVCAPRFEADALRFAMSESREVVFAGYSPGQPKDRMVYEYPLAYLRTDWTPTDLPESLRDNRFWRGDLEGTKFPRYIAPFHAWSYDQAEIMSKVVSLGLIKNSRSASPIHSNCPLNWLLMYSDLRNLGYNPYAPEFADLIREGRASRTYWRWAQPVVNWMIRHQVGWGSEVRRQLRRLNLRPEDLR